MTLPSLKQSLRLRLSEGTEVYPSEFAAAYGVKFDTLAKVAMELYQEGRLRCCGSYFGSDARGRVTEYPIYLPTASLMAEQPLAKRLRAYTRSTDDMIHDERDPTPLDAWIVRNFEGGSL